MSKTGHTLSCLEQVNFKDFDMTLALFDRTAKRSVLANIRLAVMAVSQRRKRTSVYAGVNCEATTLKTSLFMHFLNHTLL